MKGIKARTTWKAVALLVVLTAVVTTANAADVNWANPINSNYTWLGGPWELDDHSVSPPPVDGERIVFENDYSKAHCSIDVAGATLNLPTSHFQLGYGGRRWSLYDSATLTPDADPMASGTSYILGAHASLEAAAAASTEKLTVASFDGSKSGTMYFFFPVEITGTMKNYEDGDMFFYGPATIGTDDIPRNTGWRSDLYYRGDATIGTKNVGFRSDGNDEDTWFYGVTNIGTINQDGGEIYMEPTATGTVGTLNLTRGYYKGGNVAITNLNWTGGTMELNVLPDPTVVPSGSILKVGAIQATWPSVTVKSDATLVSDMTNAVYSTDLTFENDAKFVELVAPAGGPITRADLDPGVLLWKGVVNTQSTSDYHEAGDDGVSPYKGLVLNPSYSQSGEWRGTFKATPGSGDLLFKIEDKRYGIHYSGGPKFYGDSSAIGTGDNSSSTAIFECSGAGGLSMRRHFNLYSQADPDRIKTFTFTRAPGKERTENLQPNQQAGIYADQVINVINGKLRITCNDWKLEGALNLTDAVWTMDGEDYDALEDTGTVTLAGRTTLELPNGDSIKIATYLEGLEDRLTITGLPMVIFSDRNGGPWIYDFDNDTFGSMPVLANLLANSDYGSNHYHDVDIGSGGLVIGDGKFLSSSGTTNSTDKYIARDTGGGFGIIMPGQPGAITMGFAALSKNLDIEMDVVAPDATLQVGTTDPDRLLTYQNANGGFVTAIPTNRVRFMKDVSAAALNIVSGSARVDQDLIIPDIDIGVGTSFQVAAGMSATVTGTLSGDGSWTGSVVVASGGSVAPGASVGTLTGEALEITDGGAYDVGIGDADNDLLVISGYLQLTGAWTLNVVDESGGIDPTGLSFAIINYGTIDTLANVAFASSDFDVSGAGIVADAGVVTLSGLLPGTPTIPGDANENGFVDDDDLAVLLSNWESDAGTITNWALGDFTGDTDVDDDDLAVLLGNWTGPPPGGAAVPEPATLALLGLGGLSVLRRRRK